LEYPIDVTDAFNYAVSAIDWDRVIQDRERKMKYEIDREYFTAFGNSLQPKIKWKGGKDMKFLYHVIIFNTKDEVIAFKKYIPARNEREATMMAAQDYGTYDPDEHMVIVKQIADSCYEKK